MSHDYSGRGKKNDTILPCFDIGSVLPTSRLYLWLADENENFGVCGVGDLFHPRFENKVDGSGSCILHYETNNLLILSRIIAQSLFHSLASRCLQARSIAAVGLM
jgi:hypothetical protein